MVKVLLVEDDSFVRDVLLYYLEKEQSYEVTCAATAGEALAKARGHYDVILLDILLPAGLISARIFGPGTTVR